MPPAPPPKPLPYNSSRPTRPPKPQIPRSLRATPFDKSNPVYRQTARKYVRFIVAVPILVVTSYILFDRLVMGTPVKTMVAGTEFKTEGGQAEG